MNEAAAINAIRDSHPFELFRWPVKRFDDLLKILKSVGIVFRKKQRTCRRISLRSRYCFWASSKTEIAIMKDESLKSLVLVSHGPEKPSTYVMS